MNSYPDPDPDPDADADSDIVSEIPVSEWSEARLAAEIRQTSGERLLESVESLRGVLDLLEDELDIDNPGIAAESYHTFDNVSHDVLTISVQISCCIDEIQAVSFPFSSSETIAYVDADVDVDVRGRDGK